MSKFSIENILDLAKITVTGVREIISAVRSGKAEVTKDGAVMSAEELEADVDATIAATLASGDAAADRIEGRKND